MKYYIAVIAGLIIYLVSNNAQAAEVSMPEELKYKDNTFIHSAGWEDYEEIRYADITGDGRDEAIVRMSAVEGATSVPASFTLIYELSDDKYKRVITFRGGEVPGDMELVDINTDGHPDIVIYDHTGDHYTIISIFIYHNGKFRQVFENGTACYLYDIIVGDGPARVLIGRENWSDKDFMYANSTQRSLKEVWVWTGDKFEYSKKMSTTSPIPEKRAIDMTVYKMCSVQGENGPPSEEEVKECYDKEKWTFRRWIAGSRAYYIFRDQLDEVYDKRL